ncbi:MAG: hypothetical protein EOO41_03970, partial [Methanobacteriota archaeon]
RTLLDAGAHVCPINGDGWTPLHFAGAAGHAMAASMLLSAGVPVNAANRPGWTALHSAVCGRHASVTQILLDAGACTDAADEFGRSPLHRAARIGSPEIVAQLLKMGASPRATTATGWTPLHYAVQHRHSTIAHLLIQAGADAHTPTTMAWEVFAAGMSAIDIALATGMPDLASAMQQQMMLQQQQKQRQLHFMAASASVPAFSMASMHGRSSPSLPLTPPAGGSGAAHGFQRPHHLAALSHHMDVQPWSSAMNCGSGSGSGSGSGASMPYSPAHVMMRVTTPPVGDGSSSMLNYHPPAPLSKHPSPPMTVPMSMSMSMPMSTPPLPMPMTVMAGGGGLGPALMHVRMQPRAAKKAPLTAYYPHSAAYHMADEHPESPAPVVGETVSRFAFAREGTPMYSMEAVQSIDWCMSNPPTRRR